jgi:small subunit ribosomal protein S20
MANTKSARKRAEKSEQLRKKNRATRSKMRSAVRKARAAVESGAENADALLAQAISTVDSTAQKGIVHRNMAARTKSRLAAAAKRAAAK